MSPSGSATGWRLACDLRGDPSESASSAIGGIAIAASDSPSARRNASAAAINAGSAPGDHTRTGWRAHNSSAPLWKSRFSSGTHTRLPTPSAHSRRRSSAATSVSWPGTPSASTPVRRTVRPTHDHITISVSAGLTGEPVESWIRGCNPSVRRMKPASKPSSAVRRLSTRCERSSAGSADPVLSCWHRSSMALSR